MEDSFLVTNIQRFSVNDGPGIRTTVFLKGCPLNCAWCHNPECKSSRDEIYQHVDKCVRCGECARVCPEGAITLPLIKEKEEELFSENGNVSGRVDLENIRPPKIDREKCTGCMKCVEVCKYGGITKVGKDMTVEEVLNEVKADEMFYASSGGGITISGGEPLLQPDLTLALLKSANENGIHTVLDTSGFFKWEAVESIAEYVDIFLVDIKSMNDEKHKKWTGVSNKLILENIREMAKRDMNMRLRLPIIHDVNFWDLGYARSVVELAKELGPCVSGIDILPYHNFAEKKHEQLGVKYFFQGFPNLYEEDVEDYETILKQVGFCEVTVGGIQGVREAGN